MQHILQIAADSPEQLRPVDVDRVMEHAKDMGLLAEFRAWLLDQTLNDRTRATIQKWSKMYGRE